MVLYPLVWYSISHLATFGLDKAAPSAPPCCLLNCYIPIPSLLWLDQLLFAFSILTSISSYALDQGLLVMSFLRKWPWSSTVMWASARRSGITDSHNLHRGVYWIGRSWSLLWMRSISHLTFSNDSKVARCLVPTDAIDCFQRFPQTTPFCSLL